MKYGDQKKMAGPLGIGRGSLSQYLSGKRRPDAPRAFRLEKEHGIPAAVLLTGTPAEVTAAFEGWLLRNEAQQNKRKKKPPAMCKDCPGNARRGK